MALCEIIDQYKYFTIPFLVTKQNRKKNLHITFEINLIIFLDLFFPHIAQWKQFWSSRLKTYLH